MTSIDSSAAGAIAAQQATLSSKISTTVAAKQLQAAEQQGQAAVELIEGAARIGKTEGTGKHFDTHG